MSSLAHTLTRALARAPNSPESRILLSQIQIPAGGLTVELRSLNITFCTGPFHEHKPNTLDIFHSNVNIYTTTHISFLFHGRSIKSMGLAFKRDFEVLFLALVASHFKYSFQGPQFSGAPRGSTEWWAVPLPSIYLCGGGINQTFPGGGLSQRDHPASLS